MSAMTSLSLVAGSDTSETVPSHVLSLALVLIPRSLSSHWVPLTLMTWSGAREPKDAVSHCYLVTSVPPASVHT